MKDIINLLPDSIANQIAAGEVIQRPASVVKELVENSVDAGATMINVLVVDAGRTSIQVIDNGKGMSSSDAIKCFERHATSKIEKVDDLFALTTMGFRGEALASIAAIAQVELKTRTQEDEIGTSVLISASKITNQEMVACPVGSNFRVSNIFYNVPARRKFLKSNTTELNNILTAFERIVLVYPNINFTFSSNGVETLNLKASNLRQRIVDVLGKKINQDILPIDVDTSVCKISGFVGKPEAARKKCSHQYFFVNGRYMRHPYFHKAVAMAFERLVPQTEQVPYFIYIQVDPKNIDVNIHPTKTEIKFEDEHVVWQILNAAVKNTIGRFGNLEKIDFDSEDKIDIPVFNPLNKSIPTPSIGINPQYDPFKATSSREVNHMSVSQKNSSSWESLYKGLEKGNKAENQYPSNSLFDEEEETIVSQEVIEEKSPIHYQYKGKYIITAVKSGLMIIDQHRAHTRILYEKYLEQIKNSRGISQKILFPEIVEFSASEAVILEKINGELESLGFELSSLGSGSYSINGIPSGLEGVDVIKLLKEMVSDVLEIPQSAMDQVNSSLALKLALSTAIPYGQILNNEEMENIINKLFLSSNVNYSPDGKPLMGILSKDDIERMFN